MQHRKRSYDIELLKGIVSILRRATFHGVVRVRDRAQLSRSAGEKGVALLEVLVSVALLGTVLSVGVQGLAVGNKGVSIVEEITTGENIARSQLAYTMNDPFTLLSSCGTPCYYPTMPALPQGYTLTSEALDFAGADENLQTIVVTVSRHGEPVARVEGLKANR